MSEIIDEQQGGYFRVEIYADFVRKYPKNEETALKMADIVKAQNYLAERVKGCIPAELKDGFIEMPMPPGKWAKEWEKPYYNKVIQPEVQKVGVEIKKHGYRISDIGWANTFWDADKNQAWIIDYSDVKKIDP